MYRPSPNQEKVHRSTTSELLVRGGKRAGKSVSVSALFASRVLGEPIQLGDGTVIEPAFPAANPEYPRIYWIIGWDTNHIGQTLYRLLFEPGQGGSYRVIRDEFTGEWRTWNRANPSDAKRVKESQLTEPLIPPRHWDGGEDAFAWEDKKSKQFKSVKLKNGATIFAYPSSARNPKQGDAVSGIWIDEDIQFPTHLKEWQDRLTDEEGWLVWSAFPHLKNEALMDMANRAEQLADDPERSIDSVQLVMTENPFLTDKGKKESIGRMGSEEEVARRDRGELLLDRLNMYSFDQHVHGIEREKDKFKRKYHESHKFVRNLYYRSLCFPPSWTRYLSIDPSHTRTGVLSYAVPPPEFEGVRFGNMAFVEWEIVARRKSSDELAELCGNKMGPMKYEAFIMDQNAGRQTHAGRDESTMDHYAEAFDRKKLRSRQTHSTFIPGCNIPTQRYRSVRTLLQLNPETGLPRLMVVMDQCPETVKEFARYRKKMESRGEGQDVVLDEPANPRLFDMMASLEYGAHHIEMLAEVDQAYVNPSVYAGSSPIMQRVKALKKKHEEQSGSAHIVLGAGSNHTIW